MKISCMMGFHDWAKDCEECSRCGATRQKAQPMDRLQVLSVR